MAMLKENVVRQVQELLRQRMSQRAIARKLGIDRASVSKIARGKHPMLQDVWRKRRKDHPPRPCPPRLCPGCEHVVEYRPCVYCETRQSMERSAPGILDLANKLEIEPLGLDMLPEHQRRYEEVRARKLGRMRPQGRLRAEDEENIGEGRGESTGG